MNKQVTAQADKVPLSTKICWGSGGLASYFIMNTFFALALPIYQIAMKVDPLKLSLVMTLPRLLDAVTDPVMGNISDNTRFRWGRRRPYVLAGALICALLLPFMWTPPVSSETGRLAYFLLMACLYTVGYTIFVVPYFALGFELTSDYDERTRVIQWQMYLGLIGMLTMPWVYKLCFLPVFGGNEISGAFWISLMMSAVIVAAASLVAFKTRERVEYRAEKKMPMLRSFIQTAQNQPFMMLMGVNLIIRVGIASIQFVMLYINIYYVCGSKEFAATIAGLSGTLTGVAAYVGIPVATWISTHTSKRTSMLISLVVAMAATASLWWTIDPRWPYLQIFPSVIASAAMVGCWLMMSSMVADVCDADELKTGRRREGMYSASMSFTEKLSFAIATALGGLLLQFSGYDAAAADVAGVSGEVIFRMKSMLVGIQCAALVLAILLLWFYPLTREKSEEIRRKLNEKKVQDTE